jgi:hypothetical protein
VRIAFDLVTVDPKPKPTEVTVTSLADSGGLAARGTREIAEDGTISSTRRSRAARSRSRPASSSSASVTIDASAGTR